MDEIIEERIQQVENVPANQQREYVNQTLDLIAENVDNTKRLATFPEDARMLALCGRIASLDKCLVSLQTKSSSVFFPDVANFDDNELAFFIRHVEDTREKNRAQSDNLNEEVVAKLQQFLHRGEKALSTKEGQEILTLVKATVFYTTRDNDTFVKEMKRWKEYRPDVVPMDPIQQAIIDAMS